MGSRPYTDIDPYLSVKIDLVLFSFDTHHEVYGFHISCFIAGFHLNNQTQFMHSIVLPLHLITLF